MTALEFSKRLLVHAQITRFDLTPDVVDAYDRILAPHGYARICSALDELLATRSPRDGFPSIREILARVAPEMDPQASAVVAANRIWGAVAAHGWPNARSARGELGEEVWRVVEAAGGWATICSDANVMDPGTFKAQLRELAKARMTINTVASTNAIEGPSTLGNLLGEALKKIGGA